MTVMLSISIRRIMDSMKRLHTHAQHFLRSPALVQELVGHSDIKKHDIVYDLGAGTGVISSVLARRVKRVVAVELEPETYEKLVENTRRYDNVETRRADILTVTIPKVPYKIFANIPFSHSSRVVHRYSEADNPPASMYLIVQRQFAQKLLDSREHFTSELGAQLGPFFAVRIRRPLRRTDFWPHPAVDTVLLEIRQRPEPLLPLDMRTNYQKFVSRCFRDYPHFLNVVRAAEQNHTKPSHLDSEQWVGLYHSTLKNFDRR